MIWTNVSEYYTNDNYWNIKSVFSVSSAVSSTKNTQVRMRLMHEACGALSICHELDIFRAYLKSYFMSISPFNLIKLLSATHRNWKVFMVTHQNKITWKRFEETVWKNMIVLQNALLKVIFTIIISLYSLLKHYKKKKEKKGIFILNLKSKSSIVQNFVLQKWKLIFHLIKF